MAGCGWAAGAGGHTRCTRSSTHPVTAWQYKKYADDKWYPGKILGGKDKQSKHLGAPTAQLPACLQRRLEPACGGADGR